MRASNNVYSNDPTGHSNEFVLIFFYGTLTRIKLGYSKRDNRKAMHNISSVSLCI